MGADTVNAVGHLNRYSRITMTAALQHVQTTLIQLLLAAAAPLVSVKASDRKNKLS